MNEADAFRRRNRRFAWAATAALAVILGFVALTLFVLVLRGEQMSAFRLQRMALAWSPVLFYLAALWAARGLFSTLSREGFAFGAAVARGLVRIGWALTAGGTLSIATGLALTMTGEIGAGGFPVFNAPGLTIAVVGLAIVAIGGLVRRADALRRSNEKLSAELDEFF